jgi:phosphotransferase system enzyme I (PtsI)
MPSVRRMNGAAAMRRVAVTREIESLKRELPADAPHELAALLDVHLMLLHDDHLIEAPR